MYDKSMGNLFWVHWCRKSLKSCQHNALQASSVKQLMTLLLCVSEWMTTETSVPATFTNAFNCSSHQQLILSAVCSIIYVPIMSLPIEYNPITTTQMYTHYFIYYLNESYLHSKYSAVSLLNKTLSQICLVETSLGLPHMGHLNLESDLQITLQFVYCMGCHLYILSCHHWFSWLFISLLALILSL